MGISKLRQAESPIFSAWQVDRYEWGCPVNSSDFSQHVPQIKGEHGILVASPILMVVMLIQATSVLLAVFHEKQAGNTTTHYMFFSLK